METTNYFQTYTNPSKVRVGVKQNGTVHIIIGELIVAEIPREVVDANPGLVRSLVEKAADRAWTNYTTTYPYTWTTTTSTPDSSTPTIYMSDTSAS